MTDPLAINRLFDVDVVDSVSLRDRFIVPPFSVFDGKEGWWVARRRAWLSLGFKSELGRAANLLDMSPSALDAGGSGTGIFDPVLCELAYRWFCPSGGTVLDPFAGGSVRGIVAAKLGFSYVGVDIRSEQIVENNKQSRLLEVNPTWFVGDSRVFAEVVHEIEGDFIFSSPPYFGRERHRVSGREPRLSDKIREDSPPDDLSGDLNNSQDYASFCDGYFSAIKSVCARLRDDRFACFEVAEIRDKKGMMVDFVGDTIRAFAKAGLSFYGRSIHYKPLGSAAIRAGMFKATRKFVPVHEDVLVFVKGDPRKAVACIEGVAG